MKVTFKKWDKLKGFNDVLLNIFVNTGDTKTDLAFSGYVSYNQLNKFKQYLRFYKVEKVERPDGNKERNIAQDKYQKWCKIKDIMCYKRFELFYGAFKMKVKNNV